MNKFIAPVAALAFVFSAATAFAEEKVSMCGYRPLADDWARREIVIGMRHYETLPVVARHLVDHLLQPRQAQGASFFDKS